MCTSKGKQALSRELIMQLLSRGGIEKNPGPAFLSLLICSAIMNVVMSSLSMTWIAKRFLIPYAITKLSLGYVGMKSFA